ncbi:MAG: periplasmic heavy metal sensor [Phycisphaerales bacterium]|nr:periplasmic heavy metal sensor [Phycisphaerales bacterium]
MNRSSILYSTLLLLFGGAGSFWATSAWQERQDHQEVSSSEELPDSPLTAWLQLSPEQLAAMAGPYAEFVAERKILEEELSRERKKLAELFETDTASDAEILAQVDAVSLAHVKLERRVAEHLLTLRPHLTLDQRARLLGRFAEGVRLSEGQRWRHGRNEESTSERGGGPPPGRGGRGRYRGAE